MNFEMDKAAWDHAGVGMDDRFSGKANRARKPASGGAPREPVGRAIDVLIWLADHPGGPWSVRHVARELGTSPATIHRIFKVLESRELLGRATDGTYFAGLELYRVCRALADELSPSRLARPHLEALARECGECVLLGAYDPRRGQMMFVDIVEAAYPLRYVIECNVWLPVHAGATGLAILAHLPAGERKEIYARGTPALTPATLVSEEELEHEVELIAERGYAHTSGQRADGAVGFAAPLFDVNNDVYGDVCITVPDVRYRPELEEPLSTALMRAARDITGELQSAGYRIR